MYWQEKTEKDTFKVPDDIQDLSFRTRGQCLPLDHAHALSSAIAVALPWIADEPDAGVHLIHVAESGNGWMRPEDVENELLHLSRRTRMTLRLPKHRLDQGAALSGQSLDVDGHGLEIGEATVKPLSPLTTIFARYVVAERSDSENVFVEKAVAQLNEQGIQIRKLLCGKPHAFRLPDGELFTRSLMFADLDVQDSVHLQQKGLGPHRQYGCGLFVPHKGVRSVNAESDE